MGDWQAVYDGCERRHCSVMQMITDRSRSRVGSKTFLRNSDQIRNSLMLLSKDIAKLRKSVEEATTLTGGERNRRLQLLATMRDHIDTTFRRKNFQFKTFELLFR